MLPNEAHRLGCPCWLSSSVPIGPTTTLITVVPSALALAALALSAPTPGLASTSSSARMAPAAAVAHRAGDHCLRDHRWPDLACVLRRWCHRVHRVCDPCQRDHPWPDLVIDHRPEE